MAGRAFSGGDPKLRSGWLLMMEKGHDLRRLAQPS